jgi:hypothetical protein
MYAQFWQTIKPHQDCGAASAQLKSNTTKRTEEVVTCSHPWAASIFPSNGDPHVCLRHSKLRHSAPHTMQRPDSQNSPTTLRCRSITSVHNTGIHAAILNAQVHNRALHVATNKCSMCKQVLHVHSSAPYTANPTSNTRLHVTWPVCSEPHQFECQLSTVQPTHLLPPPQPFPPGKHAQPSNIRNSSKAAAKHQQIMEQHVCSLR